MSFCCPRKKEKSDKISRYFCTVITCDHSTISSGKWSIIFFARFFLVCEFVFSFFLLLGRLFYLFHFQNNSRFSSWTLFQRIYPTTNRAGQYGPEIKRAVNTCTISFPEAAILLVSDSIAPSPGQSNTDYLGTRWTCANLVPRVFLFLVSVAMPALLTRKPEDSGYEIGHMRI